MFLYVRQARTLVALFTLVMVCAPTVAFGALGLVPIVPESCNGVGGCQSVCDIAQVAQNLLNDGIYIAVFLSAMLFAWAGWKYLTNVASSEGVTKAKEIFINVAVGLVIILAGWIVVDTLMKTLTGASFGPWNKICELLLSEAISAFA